MSLRRLLAALPVTVSLNTGDDVTILLNGRAKMSRGKAASQAVHAALRAYGVHHGRVVVLDATPAQIREQCDVVIHDAGATEVEPGTLTAGVRRPEAQS